MIRLSYRVLILSVFVANLAFAQVEMSGKQKQEFLNDLIFSFENEFLWKAKGENIARQLRSKIDNGEYAAISKASLFVETLNRDLYILSSDLHLKVSLYQAKPAKSSESIESISQEVFQKGQIADRTYYLKFDEFPPLDSTLKKEIDELMSSLENPKAIIIDLRDNSGGADETVNYLIGYFFDKKKKLATSYQWNAPPKEIWALPKDQSESLSKAKLIILSSQSTFSAAEIFTQRLQLHDKAIVIGEPTPGAAHRTMTYLMSDIFLLHWPYEESLHSREELDIEGIGIIPDYLVHYNDARKIAIKYAQSGSIEELDEIQVPEKTEIIKELMEVLNAKSDKTIKSFMANYIVPDNKDQVLDTMHKFKTIWNDQCNGKIVNIHNLSEDKFRMFIKTSYGTIQMKITLNQEGKIEYILYRL